MKISSIYNGRLYTMPIPSQPSNVELEFIKRIIGKSNVNVDISNLDMVECSEDYDMYRIRTKQKTLSLKFSYDYENKYLLKEIQNVKKIKTEITPVYLDSGVIEVGDKILYLLCEFHNGEPIMDVGRSYLSTEFDLFLESYKKIHGQKAGRLTYKGLNNQIVKDFNLRGIFNNEHIQAIDNSSDFLKIEGLVLEIKKEINSLKSKLPDVTTGLVLGGATPTNIFVCSRGIQFDDLRSLCKGHVFSDIASIVLSFGLGPLIEIDMVKRACSSIGINYDKSLYDLFYAVELRKKCLSYLFRYLKEVYLYESQRVYEIVKIIDEFSLSYERMCKIPVFKENREFIRKNITEPVLEDGPNS